MNIFCCSWNINSAGVKIKKQLSLLMEKLDTDYKKDLLAADMCIIGLQEMNSKKIDIMKNNTYGFELFNIVNVCKTPDFKVTTLIYYKPGKIKIKKFERTKRCYSKDGSEGAFVFGTKGMDFFNFEIEKRNKRFPISIINTHMPFKNIKSSNNYIKNMKKNIGDFDNRKNIILMGDLNSRSILTDEGYKKSIKCDTGKDCKLFLKVKNELESLSVGQTYGLSRKRKLLKVLIDNDYFMNVIFESILKGFREKKITFLPTYKRNKVGAFKLSKKKALRLPGYADRIVYKGSQLTQRKYTSIGVFGSDHLPIISTFNMR